MKKKNFLVEDKIKNLVDNNYCSFSELSIDDKNNLIAITFIDNDFEPTDWLYEINGGLESLYYQLISGKILSKDFKKRIINHLINVYVDRIEEIFTHIKMQYEYAVNNPDFIDVDDDERERLCQRGNENLL